MTNPLLTPAFLLKPYEIKDLEIEAIFSLWLHMTKPSGFVCFIVGESLQNGMPPMPVDQKNSQHLGRFINDYLVFLGAKPSDCVLIQCPYRYKT